MLYAHAGMLRHGTCEEKKHNQNINRTDTETQVDQTRAMPRPKLKKNNQTILFYCRHESSANKSFGISVCLVYNFIRNCDDTSTGAISDGNL